MSENRAILESVFSKNRDAIKNLDDKEQARTLCHSSSTSSESTPDFAPGAHGGTLSNATGVETLIVPDVLPPVESKQCPVPTTDGLARRFSKRVSLGVHKSIIEINANDAETTLKKRWIKTDVNKPMPCIAEGSFVASDQLLGPEKDSAVSEGGPDSCLSKAAKNGRVSFASSIGKSFGVALWGMLHKKKQKSPSKGPEAESLTGGDDEEKEGKMLEKERGLIAYLKQKLSRPALTTADYDRESENGV